MTDAEMTQTHCFQFSGDHKRCVTLPADATVGMAWATGIKAAARFLRKWQKAFWVWSKNVKDNSDT